MSQKQGVRAGILGRQVAHTFTGIFDEEDNSILRVAKSSNQLVQSI